MYSGDSAVEQADRYTRTPFGFCRPSRAALSARPVNIRNADILGALSGRCVEASKFEGVWCSWYLLRTARPGEPSSTRDETTESPPNQRHGLPFDPTRPDDTMGQGSNDQQPSSATSLPSAELSYVGPISAASLKTADKRRRPCIPSPQPWLFVSP